MSDEILLHIIYLESQMLLSKKRYSDWREIQDEFADYKTSLGPWSAVGVMEFFRHDWGTDGTRWPFTRAQIAAFLASDHETITRNVA